MIGVRTFFITTTEYLQKNFLLTNIFLKNVHCLDVAQWRRPEAEVAFRTLVFMMPEQVLQSAEVPCSMDEWKLLALDETPYELVHISASSSNAVKETRIDVCWDSVLKRGDVTGKLKYATLAKTVKICLACSHGNADGKMSFSVHKQVVTDDCCSFLEYTITVVRMVKDGIKFCSGSASKVYNPQI